MDVTYGTVQYFREAFKAMVMHNLTGIHSLDLAQAYDRYESEIIGTVPDKLQTECLNNLAKAFTMTKVELFGESDHEEDGLWNIVRD